MDNFKFYFPGNFKFCFCFFKFFEVSFCLVAGFYVKEYWSCRLRYKVIRNIFASSHLWPRHNSRLNLVISFSFYRVKVLYSWIKVFSFSKPGSLPRISVRCLGHFHFQRRRLISDSLPCPLYLPDRSRLFKCCWVLQKQRVLKQISSFYFCSPWRFFRKWPYLFFRKCLATLFSNTFNNSSLFYFKPFTPFFFWWPKPSSYLITVFQPLKPGSRVWCRYFVFNCYKFFK